MNGWRSRRSDFHMKVLWGREASVAVGEDAYGLSVPPIRGGVECGGAYPGLQPGLSRCALAGLV